MQSGMSDLLWIKIH